MAGVVERPRHLRQRVLVERQQGADVDVVGAADRGGVDDVVRQEAHGRRAAGGELRVGDKVDGDEIGEGLCQRRSLAYRAHRVRYLLVQ